MFAVSKPQPEYKRNSLRPAKASEAPSLWLRAACFLLALVPVGFLVWFSIWTLSATGINPESLGFVLFFFGGFSALILAVEYAASVRLHMVACITALVASVYIVFNMAVIGSLAMLESTGLVEWQVTAPDWKDTLAMFLCGYYGLASAFCHFALLRLIRR